MRRQPLLVSVLIFTLAGVLHSMGGIYTPGDSIGGASGWPKGLPKLIESSAMVDGHWVNFSDEFFFAGDTAELNRFLARFGRLGLDHVVVIHAGTARTTALWGDRVAERYDWKLLVNSTNAGGTAEVHVWIDANVLLEELEIPEKFDVRSGGEIDRFIGKHRARSG